MCFMIIYLSCTEKNEINSEHSNFKMKGIILPYTEANLYEKPDLKSKKILKIPNQEVVYIEDSVNLKEEKEWIEIFTKEKKGWIKRNQILVFFPKKDFNPKSFRTLLSPTYLYQYPSFSHTDYIWLRDSSDEIFTQIDDFELNSEFDNLKGVWYHVKTKSGWIGFIYSEFFTESDKLDAIKFDQKAKLIYQVELGYYRHKYFSTKTNLNSEKFHSLRFLNPQENDFCLNTIFERGNCRNTRFKNLYKSCPEKMEKDIYLENYKINANALLDFIILYKKTDYPIELQPIADLCDQYADFIKYISDSEFNFLMTSDLKYLKQKYKEFDPNILIKDLDQKINVNDDFESLVKKLPYIWFNPLNAVHRPADSRKRNDMLWDYFLKKNNIFVEEEHDYDPD